MKQEIAKQWVAALRSGQYKQGRRRLRSAADKFCVLGVLCNLHAQAHPGIAARQKRNTTYMGEAFTLPPDVMKWSGISTKDGAYTEWKYRTSLVISNDSGNYSFNDLADKIRSNWQTL